MKKLKKTNQKKKSDTNVHLISQLAGADTPPDIKEIFYATTKEESIT